MLFSGTVFNWLNHETILSLSTAPSLIHRISSNFWNKWNKGSISNNTLKTLIHSRVPLSLCPSSPGLSSWIVFLLHWLLAPTASHPSACNCKLTSQPVLLSSEIRLADLMGPSGIKMNPELFGPLFKNIQHTKFGQVGSNWKQDHKIGCQTTLIIGFTNSSCYNCVLIASFKKKYEVNNFSFKYNRYLM